MTAFARSELKSDFGTFVWEIRSVNHRYLETQYKLPDRIKPLEPKLNEILREKLARGKVYVHLHYEPLDSETELLVDKTRLNALIQAGQSIQAIAKDSAFLSVYQLLNWPGVLHQPEIEFENLAAEAINSFTMALDELVQVRLNEGGRMALLIEDRLQQINSMVESFRGFLPGVITAYQSKIEGRLKELKLEIDQDRVAQEVVLLAQKADIAEELDRLDSHVEEVYNTLKKREPCGRRLDFLMQELNREANTLGAKSITKETSQGSVDLKVLIEQMREQIQNIE